ncbi:MAG: hypothetical protein R2819_00035 [Allomuricauda sp.]
MRYLKYILPLFIFLSFSLIPLGKIDTHYKLVLFEGSDWCVNCIRLNKTVLTDTAFINFLEMENIQIERIDFPQRKKLDEQTQAYNASVAEKYGFQGLFPTILLVRNNTDETVTIDYHDQGPNEFIQQIKASMTN